MVKEGESNFNQTIQIHRSTMVEKMRRLEGEGRRQPCFVILGGLDVGGVADIPKGGMSIGRDPGCDLVLKDDGISRVHARVRLRDPESIVIEDRNSTNGTFVAGERVESAVLREGDKVLLGRRTILKFALQDELEESLQRSLFESMARDGLTGAFNRKHFDRKIASDLSFALRHRLPLTLLMLDVDHFKSVNDTYGHPTGDHVLVTLTRAIQEMIRNEDTLARYGGEEFGVIAQGTPPAGGSALAERIRDRIEREPLTSLDESPTPFTVTVSIGAATLPAGGSGTPEALVSAADRNLYRAKEAGRNRVVSSELA